MSKRNKIILFIQFTLTGALIILDIEGVIKPGISIVLSVWIGFSAFLLLNSNNNGKEL